MPLSMGGDLLWKTIDLMYILQNLRDFAKTSLPGGEEGTPLYQPYRYVPPQRVWFLSRFGQKMVIDFNHYGLKFGYHFQGNHDSV